MLKNTILKMSTDSFWLIVHKKKYEMFYTSILQMELDVGMTFKGHRKARFIIRISLVVFSIFVSTRRGHGLRNFTFPPKIIVFVKKKTKITSYLSRLSDSTSNEMLSSEMGENNFSTSMAQGTFGKNRSSFSQKVNSPLC